MRGIGTCPPRSTPPRPPRPSDPLPEPWRSFLRDLDTQLAGPTELHCFGGFVVAQCYGLMRTTADIDMRASRVRCAQPADNQGLITGSSHARAAVHNRVA